MNKIRFHFSDGSHLDKSVLSTVRGITKYINGTMERPVDAEIYCDMISNHEEFNEWYNTEVLPALEKR